MKLYYHKHRSCNSNSVLGYFAECKSITDDFQALQVNLAMNLKPGKCKGIGPHLVSGLLLHYPAIEEEKASEYASIRNRETIYSCDCGHTAFTS